MLELDRWPGVGNVPTGWPGPGPQGEISTMDRRVEKLGWTWDKMIYGMPMIMGIYPKILINLWDDYGISRILP